MNRIDATLQRYNHKLNNFHFEFARNYGLSRRNVISVALHDQAMMNQLLTVAEVRNYAELADSVARLAQFPEDAWPEQFEKIAEFQWKETCGTALSYLDRPRTLGYRLLADLARVIYPTLTPKQIHKKLVRGQGWGVRGFVQLGSVYEERLGSQRKIDNFHAILQEVPQVDVHNWQTVVSDGSVALDVAALLNSVLPHWHQPITRRLLQEFLVQLKQQYPELYLALRNYNTYTQMLLSNLDRQQTPREAIEQLRYVLTSETKLLTGHYLVSQEAHRAVFLFSNYVESLSPSEKVEMLALYSGPSDLAGIQRDMEDGECVDLVSEKLAKVLRHPTNAAFLNRVPHRENRSLSTHQAWMHTTPQELLARKLLSHHIPLKWLNTVIANVRRGESLEGARIVSSLFNVLSPSEFDRFLGELVSGLAPRKIIVLLQGLEYPKVTTLLGFIDAATTENPFKNLFYFAQLLEAFVGSKSGLFELMPATVAGVEFDLPQFMRVVRDSSRPVIKALLKQFQVGVTRMVQRTLTEREQEETRAILLEPANYVFVLQLLKTLPAASLSGVLEPYGPLAFASGQLGLVLSQLSDDQMTAVMAWMCRSKDLQRVIATQFDSFVTDIMQGMPTVQQFLCIGLLAEHCRPSMLRMLDNTPNLSTLCYQLDVRGLFHVTGMVHSLVKADILVYHRFKVYASKFDEYDLEELLASRMAELTQNMLTSSIWLTEVLESLPHSLALKMWETVKEHEPIYKKLRLRDIARLSVLLPTEEFDAMFEGLQPNIVSGLAAGSDSDMAMFCYSVLPKAAAMKTWLWLQFDGITTTLTGFHNFLVAVNFLSQDNEWQNTPLNKDQIIMHYKGLHHALHYSTYFEKLIASGQLPLAIKLKNRLKQLVTTPENYLSLSIRLFSQESKELLQVIRPQLLAGPLDPDDFVKFNAAIPYGRQVEVWQCLQHPGTFGMELSDLRKLARALSDEGLRTVCQATQGYVGTIVRQADNMHSILEGLPEAKRAILLEWARPVVAALPPYEQAEWRRRFEDPSHAWQSNSLFALTPGAVQSSEAPAAPPKP